MTHETIPHADDKDLVISRLLRAPRAALWRAWADPALLKQCEVDKGYYAWTQANCCKDSKGKRVACEQRDRSAVLQAAVDGRHHWAFGSTSPHIDVVRNPGLAFPRAY